MNTTDGPALSTAIRNGVMIGMIAGAAMATYAMLASATYQHHGFFTPLFHISAVFGSPKSMMQSMTAAMRGDTFWFESGAALVGLLVHMVTGAMYGVGFAVFARRLRGSGTLVAVGMGYGLVALVLSGLVGLPVASAITGAGKTISDMADMVGWGTIAVEHLIFGLTLGVGVAASRGLVRPIRAEGQRSVIAA